MSNLDFHHLTQSYLLRLSSLFKPEVSSLINELSNHLLRAWSTGNTVFICGNGGSAANAIHMANDFHYGVGSCGLGDEIPGIRVEALPSNSAVLTCLANDTGYENIYSHQLRVKALPGDLLIVLSGSGNSPNIVNALKTAAELKVTTYGILGFDGGKCLSLVDHPLHFPINDMQISEDVQLIVGHLCMQWLSQNKPL